MEKGCESDFSSVLTILYGHNMRDGSMFAMLHKFEDEEFFKKHKKIHIYMPDNKKSYTIASVYTSGADNYMEVYNNFNDDDSIKAFLNEIRTKSTYTREKKLSKPSRYLTLSTCTGNDSKRFLVTAVKDRRGAK